MLPYHTTNSASVIDKPVGGKLPSCPDPNKPPESIAALFEATATEEPVTLSQLPLAAWTQSAVRADLSRPPSASAQGQVLDMLVLVWHMG